MLKLLDSNIHILFRISFYFFPLIGFYYLYDTTCADSTIPRNFLSGQSMLPQTIPNLSILSQTLTSMVPATKRPAGTARCGQVFLSFVPSFFISTLFFLF